MRCSRQGSGSWVGGEPGSIPIYTPNTSSYTSILQFSIQNLRFISSATPKPQLIITPLHESHVQATVICCRRHGLQIRVRSGGHDYEGLSYVSDVPFVVIELAEYQAIDVDVEDASAWVQAGATIGQLYYRIGEKTSAYGFPAGACPTVGVGGHFSGGGFGALFRKYGLAADNIIDARLVNADGEVLDKESMGEDLFWAIRGGGAGSYGVVLSWKVRLVPVPPIVTIFSVVKTLEQGANALVHRWQYIADKLPRDLLNALLIRRANASKESKGTVQATFLSVFQGEAEQLLHIMEQRFPELGVKREDCMEMTYLQSQVYLAEFPIDSPELLLQRNQSRKFFKAKSDYVKEPISEIGLRGLWERFHEIEVPEVIFSPYGGRMGEIPDTEIPYNHRKGVIYKIQYLAWWGEKGRKASKKNIDWTRRVYKYMTPYVSKSPRSAYFNYRDLDLGQNNKNGTASYSQARDWGIKYFGNNFDRLVRVKSNVDPDNFFRNEQSIPPVRACRKSKEDLR
ncbi:hypothetical protein Scep_022779 [Stephania cephalantha]|uniref:FAD-binding PCMH-type domain-containing protein n=1 Tax=Stephania cephalantha TaxID=152367 RepID=A0AAP0F8K8_9MAGN